VFSKINRCSKKAISLGLAIDLSTGVVKRFTLLCWNWVEWQHIRQKEMPPVTCLRLSSTTMLYSTANTFSIKTMTHLALSLMVLLKFNIKKYHLTIIIY
jgi:hypothetical protein